ncbi:MAG: Gx transporter family protein [Chitinispirillales bacterium]|nr:Gx transporter family protein [Chitinispirillales bacterium]
MQKAIWLLAAVALNAAELAIPRIPFLPWLKPGLANIVTVLWIIKYGFKDALLYTALRIWISGFYFGFSLFTASLSLSGGMLATVAMGAVWIALGRRGVVGTVGMAVIGALFHNAGQLAVVYFLMARNIGVLGQIPFMLGASAAFGGIVGALVPMAGRILGFDGGNDTIANHKTANVASSRPARPVNIIDKLVIALTFAVSISLMFVNSRYVLIAAAATFSLASLLLTPKKPFALIYPIKFYMLFLFIALTHLFFSYGTRVDIMPFMPFITNEGIAAFISQSLRLWCWLQTVHIFKRFGFHEMFIAALYRFFPNNSDTLEAGMIALEHFPEIVRFAKSSKKIKFTALLFHPQIALAEYVGGIASRINSKYF